MGGNNGSTLKDVCYSSKDNASSWAHKPALQELCRLYVAITRLQFLTVNYGLLAEMEVAKHLTHGTQVMPVPVQKSRLKTIKFQEAENKV